MISNPLSMAYFDPVHSMFPSNFHVTFGAGFPPTVQLKVMLPPSSIIAVTGNRIASGAETVRPGIPGGPGIPVTPESPFSPFSPLGPGPPIVPRIPRFPGIPTSPFGPGSPRSPFIPLGPRGPIIPRLP